MPKFDLAQTQAVAELFAAPREARDEAWRDQFYAAVPDATLMAFDPQVNRGPDEFPYFRLAIPDPGPVTPLEDYDGDEGKLSAAVHYLSWFLPRTYSVAAMPAGWTDSTFVTLG